MRKIKYLLAVSVMSTALLFGCGSNDEGTAKSITPEEFIEKAENNETEIKSLDFDLGVKIDANLGEEIKGDITLNGSVDENKNAKFTFNMNVDEEVQTIEGYLINENDNYTVYFSMMDMWYKMSVDDALSLTGAPIDLDASVADADASSVDLSAVLGYLKDTEVVASDSAYTLNGVIDLDKVVDEVVDAYIDIMMSVSSVAEISDEERNDFVEQIKIVIKDLKVNVSASINSNDSSFKSLEISVNNWNFDLEGTAGAVNTLKISIGAKNYNEVEEIKLPEEAADAIDMSDMMSMSGLY